MDKLKKHLQETWQRMEEMPAWNDDDKSIGDSLGGPFQFDVENYVIEKQYEEGDLQWIWFKRKADDTRGLYIIGEGKLLGEFVWYKNKKFGIYKTESAGLVPDLQGKGIALKAYKQFIDRYGGLMSDSTLTGESGSKGSFQLWQRLGKEYPYRYILDKSSDPVSFEPVEAFTREMMGDDEESEWTHFVVSKTEL
jgi:hypothetical protein